MAMADNIARQVKELNEAAARRAELVTEAANKMLRQVEAQYRGTVLQMGDVVVFQLTAREIGAICETLCGR
jgi:hypothetical protein